MERKKRSPLLAIVLAAAVCLMVIALLTGFIRPVPVIVARVALALKLMMRAAAIIA